jgi:hypothetical protein
MCASCALRSVNKKATTTLARRSFETRFQNLEALWFAPLVNPVASREAGSRYRLPITAIMSTSMAGARVFDHNGDQRGLWEAWATSLPPNRGMHNHKKHLRGQLWRNAAIRRLF